MLLGATGCLSASAFLSIYCKDASVVKTTYLCAVIAILLFTGPLFADDKSVAAKAAAAAEKLTAAEYDLRYKFTPGEILRHRVMQITDVNTRIRGTKQTARTQSESIKVWTVGEPDEAGNFTFTHSVESVKMSNKITGQAEVLYNSRTDKEPPPTFQGVKSSIGVPLATITVDEHGKIVRRENKHKQMGGNGQLIIPLPGKLVKIGDRWYHPMTVVLRSPTGVNKKVKTRQMYRLEKVEDQIATISVKTQVLTPVNDPRLQVQLMQRLTAGSLKFDIAAGRVIHQGLDLDETVLEFSGPASSMKHRGRFTENLITDGTKARTAKAPVAEATEEGATPETR